MMEQEIDTFDELQKAIDFAFWKNYVHRAEGGKHGIINGPDDNYIVVDEGTRLSSKETFLGVIPKDYRRMSYQHIAYILRDEDPHAHLEKLSGLFSVTDGDVLRFVLYSKIPLEKWIRYELASRGYDEYMNWVGFY